MVAHRPGFAEQAIPHAELAQVSARLDLLTARFELLGQNHLTGTHSAEK